MIDYTITKFATFFSHLISTSPCGYLLWTFHTLQCSTDAVWKSLPLIRSPDNYLFTSITVSVYIWHENFYFASNKLTVKD